MTTIDAGTATGTVWVTCRRCRGLTYQKRFARELEVCPACAWHAPVDAWRRVDQLLDPQDRHPVPVGPVPVDPLRFTDRREYRTRLAAAADATGLSDAVVCVRGRIEGRPVVLAVMDFRFLGGSLGTAAGEQVTAAAEAALADRVPLVVVTASGGARMQEGVLSLMQMAKTSAAFGALGDAGLLTVTVVADPTYGGVAASYASLGDVLIAEPGARLGFAGPRVIEQTIGRVLPEGFQTAEFLRARGLIDDIVPRRELRTRLARLLDCAGGGAAGDRTAPALGDVTVTDPALLEVRDAWQQTQEARNIERPTTLDYLGYLLEGFTELHGDRAGADDPAIVGGLGLLKGMPVLAVGHQKGHSTRELVDRNFGMPTPAGYRKAARLLRLAAKLRIPVLSLIDTPGAYPGQEAEETGQAHAIAENLRLMARLPVPVVAVVTGEGGSGGALALGVADRLLMLERAVYSVISPEGCAAILWQNPAATPQAARALRITGRDLLAFGVVDGVVREPDGGARTDHIGMAERLGTAVHAAFGELRGTDPGDLIAARYRRLRAVGAAQPGTAERGAAERGRAQ